MHDPRTTARDPHALKAFRPSRRQLDELRSALGDRGRDLDDAHLEDAACVLMDTIGTALLVVAGLSTDRAERNLDGAVHGRDARNA